MVPTFPLVWTIPCISVGVEQFVRYWTGFIFYQQAIEVLKEARNCFI